MFVYLHYGKTQTENILSESAGEKEAGGEETASRGECQSFHREIKTPPYDGAAYIPGLPHPANLTYCNETVGKSKGPCELELKFKPTFYHAYSYPPLLP